MKVEQQLLKLKSQIEAAKKELYRLEAQQDLKMKSLKEKGAKTKEDAVEMIKVWQEKRKALRGQIQDKLNEISEEYGGYLK